jgi:hypothetical protein
MIIAKEGVPVMIVPPQAGDPKASPQQLAAARRYVLGADGPGIVRAAQRLGISAGYLSELLRGARGRCLRVSELRRLRADDCTEGRPAVQVAPTTSPPMGRSPLRRRREEVAI